MSGVVAASKGSGRRCGAPRGERARTQKSRMAGQKPMSPNVEQVAHDVVEREEPQGLCRRFENACPSPKPVRRDA
jgi:hypothetical protein